MKSTRPSETDKRTWRELQREKKTRAANLAKYITQHEQGKVLFEDD